MFKRLLVILAIACIILPFSLVKAEGPSLTFEAALACIQKVLPAASYGTNEYLPIQPVTGPSGNKPTRVYQVKVGEPWINNDEEAPFHVALDKGFFTDEGLDVTLVAGGPGKDHLKSLAGGLVDFGVAPGGSSIPLAVSSTTPMKIGAIGALLKGSPLIYITIKPELQGKKLTPQDFIGRTIAVQPGGDLYVDMILDRAGISRDKVKLVQADYTPEILFAPNGPDFYSGWIINQTWVIEQKGYKWNGLRFSDWSGYTEYSDVIAVRQETLSTSEGKDMVRRFLRATYRGIQFMLDHPEETAKITERLGADTQVTAQHALWRFDKQRSMVIGEDKRGPMVMDSNQWDNMVATLLQYGQTQIQCK